jgi:hypothetical protein
VPAIKVQHMADNWIDRRALCGKQLGNASAVVWQQVKAAIDECCGSYRKHFAGTAQILNQDQNGHRVLIDVRFIFPPGDPRQISIVFSDAEKTIRVTVDGEKAAVFEIEADENHPFIMWQGKEIDAEQFTQIALEKPFFDSPRPPSPTSPPMKMGKWS